MERKNIAAHNSSQATAMKTMPYRVWMRVISYCDDGDYELRIAKKSGVTYYSVSSSLIEMEKSRLLTRKRDGLKLRIILTEKGKKVKELCKSLISLVPYNDRRRKNESDN